MKTALFFLAAVNVVLDQDAMSYYDTGVHDWVAEPGQVHGAGGRIFTGYSRQGRVRNGPVSGAGLLLFQDDRDIETALRCIDVVGDGKDMPTVGEGPGFP